MERVTGSKYCENPAGADRSRTRSSERDMLSALFTRAVRDYLLYSGKLQREAKEWLFDEPLEDINSDKREFSCLWVCDQLDLNYNIVAERVRGMTERIQSDGRRKIA